MNMKSCNVCKEMKPTTQFTTGKGTCMSCRNEKRKEHYKQQKVICECGYQIYAENLDNHLTTKSHLNRMKVVQRSERFTLTK